MTETLRYNCQATYELKHHFVYLINIPQLTVDILAKLQQQAYRTLIENM